MNISPFAQRNRTVEDAAADWMDAKNAEIKANKERVAVEEELLSLLASEIEGATSHQVGPYKVTLTGRLNRKMDWDAFAKLGIPAALAPVKYKPELEIKGLRYLENNEPEIFSKIESVMTIEPAKTSVTVIRTEK